jgi:hypothetical protein
MVPLHHIVVMTVTAAAGIHPKLENLAGWSLFTMLILEVISHAA